MLRDQQSEEGGVSVAQAQPLEVSGQDLRHALELGLGLGLGCGLG